MHMANRLTRRLPRSAPPLRLQNRSTMRRVSAEARRRRQKTIISLERGLSSFDQRHHSACSTSSRPRRGCARISSRRTTTRQAASGWTLNGGFNATAHALTRASPQSRQYGRHGGSQRSRGSERPAFGGARAYFNLAAFTLPLQGSTARRPHTIPGSFRRRSTPASAFVRIADSRRQVLSGERKQRVQSHDDQNSHDSQSSTWGLPPPRRRHGRSTESGFNY